MRNPIRIIFPLFLVILLFSAFSSGCSGNKSPDDQPFPMAPLSSLPPEVRSAPVTVRQSYQFAAANPEVLKQLPCYCGCGPMGHASNYACYYNENGPGNEPVFDSHALGCSICVDITLDAMRMLKQDKSVAEIRVYVDSAYSRYGPSNMP
jgi:hypothetical protein